MSPSINDPGARSASNVHAGSDPGNAGDAPKRRHSRTAENPATRRHRPLAAHPFLTLLFVLVSVVQLSGCFYSREIAHVRRDIERRYPGAVFDRELVLTLGPGFFSTVGWVIGRLEDRETRRIEEYLSEIRRVKLGVYRTERLPAEGALHLDQLSRFRDYGWEVAASVRDDDELVWVLYRERYESVRDMFILVLSSDELIIVRIEGDLNRLFERIVADELYATHLLGNRSSRR